MMDIVCNFVQQEGSEFESLSIDFQQRDLSRYNNLTLAIPEKTNSMNNVYSTKSKRSRSNYTTSQVEELEILFQNNMYPNRTQRSEIAERLQLHDQQIRVWFQNRRTKQRKLQPGLNKNTKDLVAKNSQKLIDEGQLFYSLSDSNHLYNGIQTADYGETTSIIDTLSADLKTPEKYTSSEKRSFESIGKYQETGYEGYLLNISDVIETISRHELNTRTTSIAHDHQREEKIERIKRDLELSVQRLSRSFVSNIRASSSYCLPRPITPPTPSVDIDWVINSDQQLNLNTSSF